jgi:membrane protease YdiL (CAAX protease family)
LSGITFGMLHILNGNAAADNMVAGFFLGWAFLKSGSIVVPIVLHSLGNLCVLASWVATWYWQRGLG